jgi:hypothetical protein
VVNPSVVDGRRGGWGRHCPLLFHVYVVAFQNPLRPRRSGEAYGTGSMSPHWRSL